MENLTGQKVLFLAYHGSHLYGLNTPKSDKDFKGVVIPTKEELLTGKEPKTCYSFTPKKEKHQKNDENDVDTTYFTLKAFIRLLVEGQNMAIEMLFTPRELYLQTSPEWEFLVANRHLLIQKNISSFFNLARKQAYKYSVKGERMESLVKTIAWAKSFPPHEKPNFHLDSLNNLIEENKNLLDYENKPLIDFVSCQGPKKEEVKHLQVNNLKFPLTATFKHILKGLESKYNQYGSRSKEAHENNGADFKALSHAVRVGFEAKELLTTQNITFPLIQKDFVLDIKKGKYTFAEVEKIIEDLLNELNELKENTNLPELVDETYWNMFVDYFYKKETLPKWKFWFYRNFYFRLKTNFSHL